MNWLTALVDGKYNRLLAVLLIGCALNYFGDKLLGVQIEVFHGLETFSGLWVMDMFALPFLDGLVVGWLFGVGGKWLCYFPPLIVRAINYSALSHSTVPLQHGSSLLPLGWWGFFVILVMEAAAFGGILGESMIKAHYGRSAPEAVYKKRAVEADEGDS